MSKSRSSSSFIAILFIFLSLFMISLTWFASSQPVGVLAKVLPVIAGLVYITYERTRFDHPDRHPIRRSVWILAVFILYQAISILISHNPELGIRNVLDGLFAFIVFFLVVVLLDGGFRPEWIESGLLSTAGVFAFANIPSLILWWLGWVGVQGSYFSIPPTSFRLPGAFLSHPNIEAAFINLAIPIALYRLLIEPKKSVRLGMGFLLFLFAGVEYFASSRGAWIALALSLAITFSLIWYARSGSFAAMTRQIRPRVRPRSLLPWLAILIVAAYLASVMLQWQTQHPTHAPAGLSRSGIWNVALDIFRGAPLFGNGAGSFHFLSVSGSGIPPGFYLVHAHNLILQIGAELGVTGLLITAALGLAGLWTWIEAWRNSHFSTRVRLAAYAGALSTVLMHGMVDFPFEAPVFTIAVLLILALVENANPKRTKPASSSGQAIIFITIGIAVFGITSGWQIRGSKMFTAGLAEFEAGNWKPASEKICEVSTQRESDSFYAFQCALALSVMADRSNDPGQLQGALEKYNVGISRDPFWPVHIANQAAIEFQLGNADEALRGMSTALHQAPRNARFALNLGVMYEAVGNRDAAQNAYAHAIELDPWIYRSALMNLTELRRSVIHRVEQVTFLNEVLAKTWQGWILLDQGRTSSAIEEFTHVLLLSPIVGEAHAGLAIALHRSKMDPEAIAEELRHAAFYAPGSSLVQDAIGSIALQESQPDVAARTFEQMFQILNHPNDSREYYASTYNRPSLPLDTVPQLQPNPVPPEILDHLRWLADYYEDAGDTDRAEEVRDWVLAQVDG